MVFCLFWASQSIPGPPQIQEGWQLLRRRAAAYPAHSRFIVQGRLGRPMAAKLCHIPLARSWLFVDFYLYLLIYIDFVNFGPPLVFVATC